MKLSHKLLLPFLLSIGNQLPAVSEFFQPKVYDMTLLNALSTYYQHYQNDPCDRQVLDLIGTGFYQYQIDNAHPHNKNQIYGAYIKGQISLGNLWVQVDTAIGQRNGFEKTSFSVGDVLTKIGYDFSIGDSHYFGIYSGVGIPTGKKSLKEETKEAEGQKKPEEKTAEKKPAEVFVPNNFNTQQTIPTGSASFILHNPHKPQATIIPPKTTVEEDKVEADKATLEAQLRSFGSRNFTIPVGVHMGFTLYENEEQHFSFLTDIRYLYAFSAKYYFTDPVNFTSCDASSSSATTAVTATRADYTPGNQIAMWNAFHWAWNEWNLEIGNSLYGTFGAKITAFFHDEDTTPALDLAYPLLSKFGINPYIAFSYNTTICDHPFMLGFGVGYRYDKDKLCGTTSTPDILQTASAWATIGLSF